MTKRHWDNRLRAVFHSAPSAACADSLGIFSAKEGVTKAKGTSKPSTYCTVLGDCHVVISFNPHCNFTEKTESLNLKF